MLFLSLSEIFLGMSWTYLVSIFSEYWSTTAAPEMAIPAQRAPTTASMMNYESPG
jgi:hypothetical protein